MARWKYVGLALLVSAATAFVTACGSLGGRTDASAGRLLGWRVDLGKGPVASYAEVEHNRKPFAPGIAFSHTRAHGLPPGTGGPHSSHPHKHRATDTGRQAIRHDASLG